MHYYRRDLLQPRSTSPSPEPRLGTPAAAVAAGTEPEHGSDASTMAMAANLVPTAAAILDRELAAGVLAAREAQENGPRLTGAPAPTPPSTGPQALLPLLDAVIEATADVIQAAAERSRNSRGFPDPSRATALTGFYGPDRVLRAGDIAEIPLDVPGVTSGGGVFHPLVGELLSADGLRLPADIIRVLPPTPGADPPTPVTLQVRVPSDARPGRYEGLLLLPGTPGIRAVVGFDIG